MVHLVDTQHVVASATGPVRESSHVQSVTGRRAAPGRRGGRGPAATAAALAEAVGLNRTTTWRILATLEQERLVSLNRETGWYSLGFGLIDLAGRAGGAPGRFGARRAAAGRGPDRGDRGAGGAARRRAHLRRRGRRRAPCLGAGGVGRCRCTRPRPARSCSPSPPGEVRALLGCRAAVGCSGTRPRRSPRSPRSTRSSARSAPAVTPCAAASSRAAWGLRPGVDVRDGPSQC